MEQDHLVRVYSNSLDARGQGRGRAERKGEHGERRKWEREEHGEAVRPIVEWQQEQKDEGCGEWL